MKLWVLGSGSAGNATLIECGDSRILIDAGFGTRTLAGRLNGIGVDPRSIDVCLVTHEHSDHVKGVGAGAKRWGWQVYATAGTALARELEKTSVSTFEPGATLDFSRVRVETVPTPHDAAQSVGFVITSRSTGARAAVFYDIGHVSQPIADACRDVNILVLESNHDDEMLRNGPYPRWLQARIAGDTGHLSNRHAGAFARRITTREMKHLVLAHLSERCNAPDVALTSMRSALKGSRFRGELSAARQDAVVGPFMADGSRADAPVQYAFDFV